ncbi:MAG: nucleotide exchange factor GrpE [Candidatus Moranbacteria bacterium]|nr:nucleotide exchange factor GrpE [Candidatus Moranbacteria bacterium]
MTQKMKSKEPVQNVSHDDTDESIIKNQEEGIRSEISHNAGEEETKAEANEISKEEHGEEGETKALEYLNDLKRCRADFENYKKRQQEAQKELGGYLIEKLVLDIVPVLDNFRSATQHVPPEQKDSPWVVGIQYIEKQLETVLTDNGIQTIEVKEGEAFDPKIHEALDTVESSKEQGEGMDEKQKSEQHTVAKVLQKGYKFGERVIRPAKVTVSS